MPSDPVLIAYSPQKRAGGTKTYWQRIGAAYPHDSGAGLTVLLDALPFDGRIVLLERDAADDARLAREEERMNRLAQEAKGS